MGHARDAARSALIRLAGLHSRCIRCEKKLPLTTVNVLDTALTIPHKMLTVAEPWQFLTTVR